MSLFIISPIDLSTAYRGLAALYTAGVGPSRAFSFIVESTECRPLQSTLKQLSEATSDGTSVSKAMAAFPKIFPALHRTVIAAGETSGLMPATLNGLAQMVERDHALKESIKRELTPAKINIGAAVVIVGLLAMLGLFHFEELSIAARMLLCICTLLIIITFAAATLATQINNEAEVRYGPIVNQIPGFGKIAHMMAENHFTRVLAVCHEAGILPIRSIALAAEACGSPSMQTKLMRATNSVRDGVTMAVSLENTEALSDYLVSMLKIGEESGKIAEILYRAQEQQSQIIEAAIHRMKTYVSLGTNLAALGLGGTVVFILYGVL